MTTVLPGANAGRYPDGNSLLVAGHAETILIDPSLTIAGAIEPPAPVDHVLLSHCHDDHLAGLFRYAAAAVHVHSADRLGLESLDGLMTIDGLPESIDARWREEVVSRFHYTARPD